MSVLGVGLRNRTRAVLGPGMRGAAVLWSAQCSCALAYRPTGGWAQPGGACVSHALIGERRKRTQDAYATRSGQGNTH